MEADLRKQNRIRIRQIAGEVLNATERVLGALATEQTRPSLPTNVARRQLANMLKLSRLCTHRACRRTQCCQGEPLRCLQSVMPLLPAEAFDGLLRKQPARRRKRQNTQAVA